MAKDKPEPSRLERTIKAMRTIERALVGLSLDEQLRVIDHIRQVVETGRPSAETGA